jgi:hypothetical protein
MSSWFLTWGSAHYLKDGKNLFSMVMAAPAVTINYFFPLAAVLPQVKEEKNN